MNVIIRIFAPVNTYTGAVFQNLVTAKEGIYKELFDMAPGIVFEGHTGSDQVKLTIQGDGESVIEWFKLVTEYNQDFSNIAYSLEKKFDSAIKSGIKNLTVSTKDLPVVEYINNKWERFDNWFDNPKEKFESV